MDPITGGTIILASGLGISVIALGVVVYVLFF